MTFAPVGIKCPDHAGVGGPRSAPAPSRPRPAREAQRTISGLEAPATVGLVILNVLVYMVTVYQGVGVARPGGELFDKGALVGAQIYAQGDWYRLVTAMFLHASLLHLALNMLVLYWCGTVVERALGTWRFLLVYFVAGIAGSAGALLSQRPVRGHGRRLGCDLRDLRRPARARVPRHRVGACAQPHRDQPRAVVRDPQHLDGAATSAASSEGSSRRSLSCTTSTGGLAPSARLSSG